jgi:uncharacterized membrane protein YphA (DoxX/SURF4 family)
LETEKRHQIRKLWINGCRFVLAVVFIFSGFVKAIDPLGSFYKIGDYLTAFGIGEQIPSPLILLISIILAAAEFITGVFLFFGIRRRIATSLALLLMCVMTPLTLYLAIANPVSDCGCFGDALILTNWETFGKNIVLLAAAIALFRDGPLITRFITDRTAWMVSLYTFIFVFALSFYCLNKLPIIDFRPYKVGADLRLGREQFNVDFADFYLTDSRTDKDLTDSILASPNYTFLLLSPRLETADDSNIDLINELYEYSIAHGYGFYGVTASSPEAIELWCDKTGANYPFCNSDEITLKTAIRSNPGLILLQNGIILNKWSQSQLPDEYILTDALDNLPLGQLRQVSNLRTVAYVFLWFLVPLLLLTLIDRFIPLINKTKKK